MRARPIFVVLSAASLAVAGAAPASADSFSYDAAGASFEMTMTPGQFFDPGPGEATLTCDPVGGTHPAARDACKVLTEVGGDFEALPLEIAYCPQVYDPVTVTVKGHWYGAPVEFQETYTNAACASAASDGIFWF
jgi:hypothetical protein